MSTARMAAIDILAKFEQVLSEKHVVVPDDQREGGELEASLYGESYYRLEDELTEYLEQFIH